MKIRWVGVSIILLASIFAPARGAYAEEQSYLQQLLETKRCEGCDLSGVSLPGADLRGANLHRANLIGADLSGAQLIDADLSHASLIQAELQGADLRRANLDATNLTDAVISDQTLGLPQMGIEPTVTSNQTRSSNQFLVSLTVTGEIDVEGEAVTMEQLSQQVSEFYRVEPDGVVILHAAQDAAYGDVVALLEQLRSLGGDRVALATETVSSTFP